MFSRISRLISSFFNRFMGQIEDPAMLLENNILELQKLIPELNKSVAISGSSVILLQKELAKFQEEAITLDKRIKAAIALGEDSAAKDMIIRLQDAQLKIEKLTKDLEIAKTNLNSIQQIRDLRVKEIKSKQEEIRSKVSEHRFSVVQSDIAKALDASVATSSNNLSESMDEQMTKLEQKTAENQSTLLASMYNNRSAITGQAIEQKASEMEADKLLEEYKNKANLTNSANSATNSVPKQASQTIDN